MAQALRYPTSVNFIQKTLGAQLLSGATAAATLNNVTSIQNKPGVMIVDRIDTNGVETPAKREVIQFSATSGSTVTTLTRNADGGGTDQDHAVGAIVEFGPDILWAQSVIDGLSQVIDPATGLVDTTKVVTPSAAQTLASKNLTQPTIGDFTNAGHTHQNAAGGGTLAEAALALTDVTTNDVSTSKHGFTPKAPNDTAKFLRGDATWAAPTSGSVDGWTATSDAWTFLSASSVTVPSGAASLYQKGDRVKFTQTTVKYFVVVAVTDTTLTFAVNSNYTVANAAISAISYSHSLCPIGYPTWFDFATTHGGFSANPSGYLFEYKIDGSSITINYSSIYAPGTSNATSFTLSLPVAAINTENGLHIYKDNTTYATIIGAMQLAANTTLNLFTKPDTTGWTNTGTKGAAFNGFTYKF